MIREQIAVRYSKALFELGQENGNLESIRDDLVEIWRQINENKELYQMLYNHRILPEEKKDVLDKIFADNINKYVLNFVKMLIDKRREFFIELIIQKYVELVKKEKKVLEIKVISAISLKDELVTKLKDKLKELLDYKIELNQEVDPSIIGGLILKTNYDVIDGSIRKDIEGLRETLEKIPVSELGV